MVLKPEILGLQAGTSSLILHALGLARHQRRRAKIWASGHWSRRDDPAQVALVLEEFAGRSYAKTSPVHHFWHTFDLAVTRFSDRVVDQPATADPVTREAYSREVISAGFWFGDASVPEPAFYSYTSPEPAGLDQEPLRPEQARWTDSRGAHLALLRYADARVAADPRGTVLDFYESAYRAGAARAGWDTERLRTPFAPPLS
jgi:hypothetical protein